MINFLYVLLQKEVCVEENNEYREFELFQNNLPHISQIAVCLWAQFQTLQKWGPIWGHLTSFSALQPRLRPLACPPPLCFR